jgi:hypothetical protein
VAEFREARARTTDPETSHEAAASVTDLRKRQNHVLQCLKVFGPFSLEGLVTAYKFHGYIQQSDSGIRTRCSELVRMGLVEDSGQRARTASGRQAIVWRVRL